MNPNFENLGDRIKITLYFKGVNHNKFQIIYDMALIRFKMT